MEAKIMQIVRWSFDLGIHFGQILVKCIPIYNFIPLSFFTVRDCKKP